MPLSSNDCVDTIFLQSLLDIFEIKRFPFGTIANLGVEDDVVTKRLEVIIFRPPNPFADHVEVFLGMNARDDGRTEFIIEPAFLDQLHALLNLLHVYLYSHSERIFLGRVLDIHRDMIGELSFENFFQYLWLEAIGIELDKESHAPDALEKRNEVRLYCGFSPGHTHSIEESPSLLEESEEILLIFPSNFHHLRTRLDEVGVMTKRTAKIAANGEHHRRNLARIINQRQFLEAAYKHMNAITNHQSASWRTRNK